jgi:hypothetical protein
MKYDEFIKHVQSIAQLESRQAAEQATHLFEEPGALAEVARLAGIWLQRHLLPAKELGPHLTNLDW